MAINNIPGVGPTNADIATAVAAPSAATIAAAVAAPSSATIATAVAAAVPTTAEITSIVQANAGSPYGGTLTSIGVQAFSGVSSVTFSSLSGYKNLQFYITGASPGSSNADFQIRFNGDSGANYAFLLPYFTNTTVGNNRSQASGAGLLAGSINSNSNICFINGEIKNSNSSSYKVCSVQSFNNASENRIIVNGWNLWNNSAAINSITFFFNQTATVDTNAKIYLLGGN